MRSKDSGKMLKIVEYINDKYFSENYVPTLQEIATFMGMSKGNVSDYLKEMEQLDMVTLNGGWRSITTAKIDKTKSDILRVPVVGEIACGTPILAEQNIESYLTISGSFLGSGNFFALRAVGDSMINANICDGDLIVVKQQNSADEGQIVVALIDDSATLKRYYIDEKRHQVRLHPENDNLEDMFFDKVNIQGVVTKVIKDIT